MELGAQVGGRTSVCPRGWRGFPAEPVSCPFGDVALVPRDPFPPQRGLFSLRRHFSCPFGSVSPWRWFHVPLNLLPPQSQFLVPWEPLFVSLRIHSPLGAIFRVLLGLFPCGDGPLGTGFLSLGSCFPQICFPQSIFLVPSAPFPLRDSFMSCGRWFHIPLDLLPSRSRFLVP